MHIYQILCLFVDACPAEELAAAPEQPYISTSCQVLLSQQLYDACVMLQAALHVFVYLTGLHVYEEPHYHGSMCAFADHTSLGCIWTAAS